MRRPGLAAPWRGVRRFLVLAAAASATLVAAAPGGPAHAHPLGNLTVNAAVDVVVRPGGVGVTYVLDLAELPTVQARQAIDAAASASAWATERCSALAAGLRVGDASPVPTGSPALTFPPGQGGLATLRLVCPMAAGAATFPLTVEDTNDLDRIGWREVVVRGDGMRIETTDAPAVSPSALLTAYPADGAPERRTTATFSARPDAAVAGGATVTDGPTAPASRGADGLTRRLQDAVADRDLTVPLATLALALAFVLGGLHSLAPGHGKTVMAATVVAQRGGAAREVLTIGGTVAATHTGGVLVLGLGIWSSQAVAPDRVLPWLTFASGGLLVVTGVTLLVRRLRGGPGHHHHGHGHPQGRADHAHGHGHPHPHDDHDHDHPHHTGHDHAHSGRDHASHDHAHPHDDHDHAHPHLDPAHAAACHHHDGGRAAPLSRRWLVAMGMAGGMVPTPSALVVLLGAAALGRTWFGVVLVAVYGIGMATTLLAAGLALVRLQAWLERHWYGTRWLDTVLRVAPVVTALALTFGGITLAVRSMSGV